MFLPEKENPSKIGLIIVALAVIVLFVGSLKMLADSNIVLDVNVVAPTTPSTPGDGGVVPPIPPVVPVIPVTPDLPGGIVEEIKEAILSPVTPTKPTTNVPGYNQKTITKLEYTGKVVVTSLGYRLIILLVTALILANLYLFFILFWPRKKSIVYNSENRKLVEGVKVELLDKNKKSLQSVLTNKWGEFEFDPEKMNHSKPNGSFFFYLKVAEKGYIFPSKKLKGKKRDDGYRNLYFGEQLRIKNKYYLNRLGTNIPLDPVKKK